MTNLSYCFVIYLPYNRSREKRDVTTSGGDDMTKTISNEAVTQLAKSMGMTEKQVLSTINSIKYREEYNKRPSVRAARKVYNRRRQGDIKEAMELLRQKREAA